MSILTHKGHIYPLLVRATSNTPIEKIKSANAEKTDKETATYSGSD